MTSARDVARYYRWLESMRVVRGKSGNRAQPIHRTLPDFSDDFTPLALPRSAADLGGMILETLLADGAVRYRMLVARKP